LAVLSISASMATLGCNKEEVKLVPAEGTVLIDGQPAANISVQFMPDIMKGGKGPTSYGITDGNGKFRLKTHAGKDGAAAGPHNIVLADLDEERPPQGTESRKLPRLDSKYSATTNGLSADVKGDGQPIEIKIPKFRG
jgi:hypothetical protein